MYYLAPDLKIESLSARRAWIETCRKLFLVLLMLSLSARRAWIETGCCCYGSKGGAVALRKEGVD